MNFSAKRLLIFILVILTAIISVSCQYDLLSSENSNYPVTLTESYDKSAPVFIIGHKNPDSDSVCSAVAYADFLTNIGCDAVALAAGDLNAETLYALEKFDVNQPEIISDAGDGQYIIVDHSSYDQSVDNMISADILGIVDHHAIGNIETSEPVMYIGMPFGSTCSIIFSQYELYNVEISKKIAGVLLTGILSDTLGLKSSTTSEYDRYAVETLMPIAGIQNYSQYTKEILDAGNNYDNMTTEEIVKSDLKEYNAGHTHFAVGYVQSTDKNQLSSIEKKINDYMNTNFASLCVDQCYIMMVDLIKMQTKLLCYGDGALDTAKKAFNTEDDEIIIDGVSRKKQIIPPLTEALENQ